MSVCWVVGPVSSVGKEASSVWQTNERHKALPMYSHLAVSVSPLVQSCRAYITRLTSQGLQCLVNSTVLLSAEDPNIPTSLATSFVYRLSSHPDAAGMVCLFLFLPQKSKPNDVENKYFAKFQMYPFVYT
jgi:hypothetical protein